MYSGAVRLRILRSRSLCSLVPNKTSGTDHKASVVTSFAFRKKEEKERKAEKLEDLYSRKTSPTTANAAKDKGLRLSDSISQNWIQDLKATKIVEAGLSASSRPAPIEQRDLGSFVVKPFVNIIDVIWTSVKNPKLLYIWCKQGSRWTIDITTQGINGVVILGQNLRKSSSLSVKFILGYTLSRRDKILLSQTRTDLIKAVPLSLLSIFPGGIFVLPLLVSRNPQVLPSTFQYGLHSKEERRRQKKLRLELAPVIQSVVNKVLKEALLKEHDLESELPTFKLFAPKEELSSKKFAKERLSYQLFCLKSRMGEPIPKNVLEHLSKVFANIQIENLQRPELVVLCRYMVLNNMGDTESLRLKVNQKLNQLRNDDSHIHWEGVDSLSATELRQACQDRGMATTGLTKLQLQQQLKIWISLSMNKDVSPLLLLLFSANQLQQRLTMVNK